MGRLETPQERRASEAERLAEHPHDDSVDGRADDLEFSDYGRSPRFGSGWWIIPGLLMALIVSGLIVIAG